MAQLHSSQYKLRKTIGILGLALPILLLLNHDNLLGSMSHYYYTSANIFFVVVLSAFGLILFTYDGYPVDKKKKELFSDRTATTLAAIFILIAVLVPTDSKVELGTIAFQDNPDYLFGHNNNIKSTIHLVSAALFFILLGYMCYVKFPMSPSDSSKRKLLYKTCGIIIWAGIGSLIVMYLIDALFMDRTLNEHIPGYIFWMESLIVWAFGIAWLIKGNFILDIKNLFSKK